MSSLEMPAICTHPRMLFVAEARQADAGNTIPRLPTGVLSATATGAVAVALQLRPKGEGTPKL